MRASLGKYNRVYLRTVSIIYIFSVVYVACNACMSYSINLLLVTCYLLEFIRLSFLSLQGWICIVRVDTLTVNAGSVSAGMMLTPPKTLLDPYVDFYLWHLLIIYIFDSKTAIQLLRIYQIIDLVLSRMDLHRTCWYTDSECWQCVSWYDVDPS